MKGVTIDEDDSSDDEARFASLGRTGDVRRVHAHDDDGLLPGRAVPLAD